MSRGAHNTFAIKSYTFTFDGSCFLIRYDILDKKYLL